MSSTNRNAKKALSQESKRACIHTTWHNVSDQIPFKVANITQKIRLFICILLYMPKCNFVTICFIFDPVNSFKTMNCVTNASHANFFFKLKTIP